MKNLFNNKKFRLFLIIGFFAAIFIFGIINEIRKEKQRITISDVSVKNFEDNPIKENESNDILFVESPQYQIVHIEKYNQFLISINASPFEEIRKKAEDELLKSLDISKEDACKLNVSITTPNYANPDLAGQTFPLSFCK